MVWESSWHGRLTQRWWYCLKHHTVGARTRAARPRTGSGPYPTEEEAEHALETVRRRNEEWDAQDGTDLAGGARAAWPAWRRTLRSPPVRCGAAFRADGRGRVGRRQQRAPDFRRPPRPGWPRSGTAAPGARRSPPTSSRRSRASASSRSARCSARRLQHRLHRRIRLPGRLGRLRRLRRRRRGASRTVSGAGRLRLVRPAGRRPCTTPGATAIEPDDGRVRGARRARRRGRAADASARSRAAGWSSRRSARRCGRRGRRRCRTRSPRTCPARTSPS